MQELSTQASLRGDSGRPLSPKHTHVRTWPWNRAFLRAHGRWLCPENKSLPLSLFAFAVWRPKQIPTSAILSCSGSRHFSTLPLIVVFNCFYFSKLALSHTGCFIVLCVFRSNQRKEIQKLNQITLKLSLRHNCQEWCTWTSFPRCQPWSRVLGREGKRPELAETKQVLLEKGWKQSHIYAIRVWDSVGLGGWCSCSGSPDSRSR